MQEVDLCCMVCLLLPESSDNRLLPVDEARPNVRPNMLVRRDLGDRSLRLSLVGSRGTNGDRLAVVATDSNDGSASD